MEITQKSVAPPGESRVKLRSIARTFLCIGASSFSLAALGEAEKWLTQKKKWFTAEEYFQGLGLAQVMPGAPTVNLFSYLGFRLRGLPGAAAAAVFFLIPSFLLMLLLSYLYFRYGELPLILRLFHGLAALVIGLVLNTILNLWKSGVKTVFNRFMALTGFALIFWFKMGIIKLLLIAGSASLGMVLLTLRFPVLTRWTDTWSGLRKNSAIPVANAAAGCTDEAGFLLDYSPTPKPLDWPKLALLVLWLILILATDLVLINLRPELMRMGRSFLQIGALTFGSGYAMLPFIQRAAVSHFGWITDQQFAVALAMSLITPGPVTIIGVFIGYKVGGLIGAVAGMVNMYFPAWAITSVIAAPYAKLGQVVAVKKVIGGIVAAFIGTLLMVLIKLSANTLLDVPSVALAGGAFVAQRFAEIDTIWIVVGGALLSLVI
ncbi:MAG: chromate efflux transporter [Syntrophobacteraceae bacterium]|nr:chromate efflux transporter [Syntrophobacteraceae bacterium]